MIHDKGHRTLFWVSSYNTTLLPWWFPGGNVEIYLTLKNIFKMVQDSKIEIKRHTYVKWYCKGKCHVSVFLLRIIHSPKARVPASLVTIAEGSFTADCRPFSHECAPYRLKGRFLSSFSNSLQYLSNSVSLWEVSQTLQHRADSAPWFMRTYLVH